MTTKYNPQFEHIGKAFGRNKKDAQTRFKDLHPKNCKGRKFRLTYLYSDPPYRIYEVEWSTVNRWGKRILMR